MLDCDNVPFQCRKFHEHGYIFWDCPLNVLKKDPTKATTKEEEGFTKISSKWFHNKKTNAPTTPKRKATNNSFEAPIDL